MSDMIDLDEYIDDVREKISKIPNFDKESIESMLEVLPNLGDFEARQLIKDIDSVIEPAFQEHKLNSQNPVMSFPTEEESKGDVKLGHACAGDQVLHLFCLTTENLRESIFCSSRAGHGKTSLVFHFVDDLVAKRINFFIPDWKNDYRSLAQKYPDIEVLNWSVLKFNPLTNAPDGMELKDWHRVVFTIFCHSFGLFGPTAFYLLQCIGQILEEKSDITFKDLENFLKIQSEQSRKRSEYHDVAENRIFSLNHSIGNVLNVKYGWNVKDLFKRQLIIEMSPLDFPVASFLIQCLIMHEFYRRLKNNIRMNRKSTLDPYFINNFTLIIMDEAHLTQYRGQEDSLVSTEFSAPVMTTFFSQSRELMMATFALTQFPHLVMESFKDNAGTKIIGNITETNHQRDLAASIGLDRDDEKVLGKLKKGYWVARVSGRTKPFLLRTPEIDRGNLVAEAEMLVRSKRIITEFEKTRAEIEARMFLGEVERKLENKTHLPELPEEAWKVLNYVFEHEFSYQKQIADGVGLSAHTITDIKNTLISKDLIRIEKFPVYDHERVHYVLTPKTLKYFEVLNKNPNRIDFWKKHLSPTTPGYYHRYMQHLFANMHRKLGWRASIERILPNKRKIDVYLYREEDGRRKALEIESTTRDLENKIKVVTDGYAEELVLLYKEVNSVMWARARLEKIKDIPGDRIWIGTIRDYIERLTRVKKERESAGNKAKQGTLTHGNEQNGKPSGNGVENN